MDSYFSLLNLSFVENCHISIFTTFAKQSMINRLSNAINRNRSAAKISKVMSSSLNTSDTAIQHLATDIQDGKFRRTGEQFFAQLGL